MWIMRIVLGWVGAAALLAGFLTAGIAVANATVFSASAFVRDYLTSLTAGRLDEVLSLPGVDARSLDERMLDPAALGPFDWHITGEVTQGDVHRVAVAFTSRGRSSHASLMVERIGSRAVLFPAWGFASAPVTPLTLSATGDNHVMVGDVPLELAGDAPATFAVLTPGVYVFSHHSEFLDATPVTVLARGGATEAELDIRPNEAFIAATRDAIADSLAECTSQHVLFPTGCPFGNTIDNRVVSEPQWTIAQPPDAVPVPADEHGLWELRDVPGVAHLSVQVQSIFDGTVTWLEKDVPFTFSADIGFIDGELALVPVRAPAS